MRLYLESVQVDCCFKAVTVALTVSFKLDVDIY